MPIASGIMAPDFTLQDESGNPRQLSSLLGKPIVLYFYPKDDTPGCTREACAFRDDYDKYKQRGVTILGVSPDSAKSHTKFRQKFSLPFTLLSDPGHKICNLYGVWGEKKFMGKSYKGVLRTTFLIGPDGRVLKVFENVKPDGHSQEILSALSETG
jgi:peroxiredoxin Q/BCP